MRAAPSSSRGSRPYFDDAPRLTRFIQGAKRFPIDVRGAWDSLEAQAFALRSTELQAGQSARTAPDIAVISPSGEDRASGLDVVDN